MHTFPCRFSSPSARLYFVGEQDANAADGSEEEAQSAKKKKPTVPKPQARGKPPGKKGLMSLLEMQVEAAQSDREEAQARRLALDKQRDEDAAQELKDRREMTQMKLAAERRRLAREESKAVADEEKERRRLDREANNDLMQKAIMALLVKTTAPA